jgi:hypothetical protein
VIQIFHLNSCTRGRRDLSGVMTLLATQSGMAAREQESRLAMIHGLPARLPADQRKVRAIVVGVAPNAIFAGSVRSHPERMHAAVLRQAIPDFRVSIQAFEFHSAGAQVVAFRAAQDSGK